MGQREITSHPRKHRGRDIRSAHSRFSRKRNLPSSTRSLAMKTSRINNDTDTLLTFQGCQDFIATSPVAFVFSRQSLHDSVTVRRFSRTRIKRLKAKVLRKRASRYPRFFFLFYIIFCVFSSGLFLFHIFLTYFQTFSAMSWSLSFVLLIGTTNRRACDTLIGSSSLKNYNYDGPKLTVHEIVSRRIYQYY